MDSNACLPVLTEAERVRLQVRDMPAKRRQNTQQSLRQQLLVPAAFGHCISFSLILAVCLSAFMCSSTLCPPDENPVFALAVLLAGGIGGYLSCCLRGSERASELVEIKRKSCLLAITASLPRISAQNCRRVQKSCFWADGLAAESKFGASKNSRYLRTELERNYLTCVHVFMNEFMNNLSFTFETHLKPLMNTKASDGKEANFPFASFPRVQLRI